MCSKKPSKIEESNQKRLQSLNEKLNEFQLKKKLVRLSLHDLDSGKKSNKIIFDDEDDQVSNNGGPTSDDLPVKAKKAKKETEPAKPEPENAKRKLKLLDSDSEPDEAAHDKEKTLKMLETKVNLDQKKANKLIYLKTKFSNDDQRFKIDERFAENESKSSSSGAESSEASEPEEIDEDEESKPKKTNKKQLKKEKLSALKILEEITAKPILKPPPSEEDQLEHKKKKGLPDRNALKSKPVVRYDPTRGEHRRFEITQETETSEDEESSEDDEKPKSKKPNEKQDEPAESKPVAEDTSKYFKIEPNLKDLFSASDVFKFKFTNESDESDGQRSGESDQEEATGAAEKTKRSLKPNIFATTLAAKSKFSSSSESESEGQDEDDVEEEKLPKPSLKKNLEKSSSKPDVIRSLLPNFETDKEILDALSYFGGKESCPDLENFSKDWSANREKLVEECKKKNKRMLRIKKNQESQKLLPWKASNKSLINRNKSKKN